MGVVPLLYDSEICLKPPSPFLKLTFPVLRRITVAMQSLTVSIKKVLISESVDKSCEDILKSAGIDVTTKVGLSKEQLIQEVKGYDGLVVRSATKVTADIIRAGTNLKVIGRAGVGVDNIDCDAATKCGILVINAPGGNTLSAAELTCGMIVSLSRNIPGACASLKSGKWDRKGFSGTELLNKTLAIIGLGRIGREVAQRMQSFGMTTIGFDPLVPAEVSIEFGVQSYDLETIWPLADYITVHTPLIPQTRNLINDEVLKKCKKGVKLVNVARGGIIDEDAVVKALNSGQCGGIGFDVFLEEPPKNTALIQHPKTICTPHLGASTEEAQKRVAEEIAEQFKDLKNGRFIPGVVNAPAFCHLFAEGTQTWVHLSHFLALILGTLVTLTENGLSMKIEFRGLTPNVKHKALELAALVGILVKLGYKDVNYVNAPVFAKEAKIEVTTTINPVPHGDANSPPGSVTIHVQSGQESHSVSGELKGIYPALCAIDGARFSSPPTLSDNTILCKGKHGPAMTVNLLGTLAKLGTVKSAYWSNVHEGCSWCIIDGNFSSDAALGDLKQHLDFWANLKLC